MHQNAFAAGAARDPADTAFSAPQTSMLHLGREMSGERREAKRAREEKEACGKELKVKSSRAKILAPALILSVSSSTSLHRNVADPYVIPVRPYPYIF